MPRKTHKVHPSPSSLPEFQEDLRSFMYKNVNPKLLEYRFPNSGRLYMQSLHWPNGKRVVLETYVDKSCARGYTLSKVVIKINNELYEFFGSDTEIGYGASGSVQIARHFRSGLFYPVKVCTDIDSYNEYQLLASQGMAIGWAQAGEFEGRGSSLGYTQVSYTVMPYLGSNLSRHLQDNSSSIYAEGLDSETCVIAIEISYRLMRLHFGLDSINCMAHLDLKTNNMLYRPGRGKGDKIKFCDFETAEIASRRVNGRNGTVPYSIFSEEFKLVGIHAWIRDVVAFKRIVTGVDDRNRGDIRSSKTTTGLIEEATLKQYGIWDFLFVDPTKVNRNYTSEKAVVVTAILIAAKVLREPPPIQQISAREGLAAMIIHSYFFDGDLQQNLDVKIREWVQNHDVTLEDDFRILLRFNLIEGSKLARQDSRLMAILHAPEYFYEYKRCAAILFKLGAFNSQNIGLLNTFSRNDMNIILEHYFRCNFIKLKAIFNSESALIDQRVSNLLSLPDASNLTPYIAGAAVRVPDEDYDLFVWMEGMFNQVFARSLQVQSSTKEFALEAHKRALFSVSGHKQFMLWLKDECEPEQTFTLLQFFFRQQTSVNIVNYILHFKNQCSIDELISLFRLEKYIYDWALQNPDIDISPGDNILRLIKYSQKLEWENKDLVKAIVGFILGSEHAPEILFTLNSDSLFSILIFRSIEPRIYSFLQVDSFATACVGLDSMQLLSTENLLNLCFDARCCDYRSCGELSACFPPGFDGATILANVNHIILDTKVHMLCAEADSKNFVYYSEYPSLKNVIHIMYDSYKLDKKNLKHVIGLLLSLYKCLDELASSENVGFLQAKLLDIVANDRLIFNDLMHEFFYSITVFIDEAIARVKRKPTGMFNLFSGDAAKVKLLEKVLDINGQITDYIASADQGFEAQRSCSSARTGRAV